MPTDKKKKTSSTKPTVPFNARVSNVNGHNRLTERAKADIALKRKRK